MYSTKVNDSIFHQVIKSVSRKDRDFDTNAMITQYYPYHPLYSESIPIVRDQDIPAESYSMHVLSDKEKAYTSKEFLGALSINKLYEDTNEYIQSSDINYPLVATGKLICPPVLENDTCTLSKLITYDEFKSIPRCSSGGRVGLTPVIIEKDIPKVIISRAANGLIGDFGGGIKYKQNESPYETLCREVSEEVPTWSPLLLKWLDENSSSILAIHYQERYFPTTQLAYYPLRVYITIFMLVPYSLLSIPLCNTREITSCYKIPLDRYVESIDKAKELFPGDPDKKNDYRFWKLKRNYVIGINSGLDRLLRYFFLKNEIIPQ